MAGECILGAVISTGHFIAKRQFIKILDGNQ